MAAFRRMVVGTDGSDSAWRAVDHAVRLAGKTGAEIVVANAYSPAAGRRSELAEVEPGKDVGASILRDVTASFQGRAPLRCVLREGDPTDQLIAVAADEDADVIVVGNRGLSRRRSLIGSVPSRVAHRAPCGVLIARTTQAVPGDPYRRVLIGTDGSATANRAVQQAMDLVRAVGGEALLVHAGDPHRGREVLRRTIESLPDDPATVAVEGEPAEALIDVARNEGCDLIAVGNRGMTGARRFLTSVPSRVARGASCHVLLAKTT